MRSSTEIVDCRTAILAAVLGGWSLAAQPHCAPRRARAGACVRTAYFYKPPVDGTPASFIATRFDLVLLTHGDGSFRRKLRRQGYAGPVLQTVGANEAEGPGPYANHRAACNESYAPYQRTVADEPGVFCRDLHPHESWFLHNRHGERVYSRVLSAHHLWRTTYAMNPAAPGWRHFFAQRLLRERRLGYDGYFLDNLWLSLGWLRQTANGGQGLAEFHDSAALRVAVTGFLRQLRRTLPKTPIWANLTNDPDRPGDWDAYLPYLDGVMVEDFLVGWRKAPLSPARRLGQMQNVAMALRMGKSVLLVAQGRPKERERLARSLAAYWLLSNGRLFYRFTDAFAHAYRDVAWTSAYDHGPGPAAAPARRRGWTWSRTFHQEVLRLDLQWQHTSGIPQRRQRAFGFGRERRAIHRRPAGAHDHRGPPISRAARPGWPLTHATR